MPYDLAVHISNLVGDESVKVVVDAALRPVAELITRTVARVTNIETDDQYELARAQLKNDRLQDTVASLNAELTQMVSSGVDWCFIGEEAKEPSFQRFVEDAVAISSDTTLESKRLLAGALIARRLEVKTDSAAEILLRRALATINDLTENQLRILAAAILVEGPPTNDGPLVNFESRDEAEKYLYTSYFTVARRLKNTLYFGESEFGALESVGALRLRDDRDVLLVSEHESSLDRWFRIHGAEVYDGLEGELGTEESHRMYRKRFPTTTILQRLAASAQRGKEPLGRRLDSVTVTPLGETIGTLVLEQLLGVRLTKRVMLSKKIKADGSSRSEQRK